MRSYLTAVCIVTLFLSCSTREEGGFTVPPDYRSWGKPVKKLLDYPVPGHGPTFRVIYANKTAFTASVAKNQTGTARITMPDGSIIIKEIYKKKGDVNKKEPELTIMVKNLKSKLSLHGWFYYVKHPGKPITRIDGRLCIGCHEAANEPHPYFDKNAKGIFRDYLFTSYIK
ncbi:MAG: hypothetical protein A2W19_00235 [Spirochaetes bacterium RBG_16_49_21]|nr:MAG: hypothetical protein A2W19_00235 [Spirochaetes bacterium RBG_16_49_21]